MCRTEMKIISVTLILLFIFVFYINNCYAINSSENKMRVTITNDNKELNDTHEIMFITDKSPDVVSNKIAPGVKAKAELEVLVERSENPVSVYFEINDKELNDDFILISKLGDTEYHNNQEIVLTQGEKEKLTLELYWTSTGNYIENLGNNIKIPIKIRAESEIK